MDKGILKDAKSEWAKRKKYESRAGNAPAAGRDRGRREDGSVNLL